MRPNKTICLAVVYFLSFVTAASADVLLDNTYVYAPDALAFDNLANPDWVTGAFFSVSEDTQINSMAAVFGRNSGLSDGEGGFQVGIYEVNDQMATLIPESIVQVQIPTWDQVFDGDVMPPTFFDTWATVADYANSNVMVSAGSSYIFGIVSPGADFSVGAVAHVDHVIPSTAFQLTRIAPDGSVDFSDQYIYSHALLRLDGRVVGAIQGGSAIPEPSAAVLLISIAGWVAARRRK